jgi:hypothetical protein
MSTIHALVKAELERYPRGARGSSQNLFRAAYAAFRLNGLVRRPQITDSALAALDSAVAAVRRIDSGFVPSVVTA